MVHMHQTELMTVTQAADRLGWSRWKVVRHLKSGDLEGAGQKLGINTSLWLVDREIVERLATERDAGAA